MDDELIDEPDDLFDDYEALDHEEEENAEGEETTTAAANGAETGEKIEAPKRRVIRNPRLKFDADRLCGERGLPVLIDHYSNVKFKGKGQEVQNVDRLLAILEHWTHRLFPSMKFADSLRQIEKLGKKRAVQVCVGKIRMNMPILNGDFERDEEEDNVRRGTDPDPEVNHGTEFDHLVEDYQRTHDNEHRETMPENDSHPTTSSSLLNEPSTSRLHDITEEQRLKIERNRKLAAERLRARLSNLNSALSSTNSSLATSNSIATTSVIPETLNLESQVDTFSNLRFHNNEETANFDSEEIRKPNKRLRIDSEDEDYADIDNLVESSLYDDPEPTLTSLPSCRGTASTSSNQSQPITKSRTVWQNLNEYDKNKNVNGVSQNHYRSKYFSDENSDSGIDGDSIVHHRSKKKCIVDSDDEDDDMHQAKSDKRLASTLNREKDNEDRDDASHNLSVLSDLSEVDSNINSSLPDKNSHSTNSTTSNGFRSKVANNGQDDEDSDDGLFEKRKSAKKVRIRSDDEDSDDGLFEFRKSAKKSRIHSDDEDSDDGHFEYKKSAKKFRIDSDEDGDIGQEDSAKKMPNILDSETDNDNSSHNISVSSNLSQVENNQSSSLPDKSAESSSSTTADDLQQVIKKQQKDEDLDDGLFEYKKSAKKFRIDSDDDDDMGQENSAKKMPNILDTDNASHNIAVSSSMSQMENNLTSSLPDKSAESSCSAANDNLQQARKKQQKDEDSDDGLFEYKKSAKKFRIHSDDEDDAMGQENSAKKMPNILNSETDNDNASHNISVSSSMSQVENNLSSSLPDKSAESSCSPAHDNLQKARKKQRKDEDSDDGLFEHKKPAKKFRIDSDEEGDNIDIDQLVESSSGHELNGANGNNANCEFRNEVNVGSSSSPTDKDSAYETNNHEIE